MELKHKINRMRSLYILKNGKEPTHLILGNEYMGEIKGSYAGMRLIIDNSNIYRVEVGDFTVCE